MSELPGLRPGRFDPRDLLIRQLDLAWGFATAFIIDAVDEELTLWKPSDHVVTVHRDDGEWAADWPDEEPPPLPDATIGWLLWHIEWWWNNAIDAVEGRPTRPPGDTRWSGSTDGIAAAYQRWRDALTTHNVDAQVSGLMPEPRPLWFIASWVTFELTKNLAEINQLKMQHANRAA